MDKPSPTDSTPDKRAADPLTDAELDSIQGGVMPKPQASSGLPGQKGHP